MRTVLAGLIAVRLWCAIAAQAPPAPAGFTLTLDGDGFERQTFQMKPLAASYVNNLWRSSRDPRIDRVDVASQAAAGAPQLQLGVPARLGAHAFDRRDEDRDDRNPYLHFDLFFQDRGEAGPRIYHAEHVDVTITRLDPVGGRIEGTVTGTVTGCAASSRASGGCRESVTVAVNGSFSVVRVKDRVVD